MHESLLWRGREMERPNKRHPVEIRFSPLSLLCLLLCWVGVSGLIFYAGILAGRMEQMREIRKVYRADELVVADEEIPNLSFEEKLVMPEEEPDGAPTAAPETGAAQPRSEQVASGESTQTKVLQVASFRTPENAELLVRELRGKGYRCFQRLPGTSGSGDEYCRVFVGPLPDEQTAMRVKEQLEEEGGFKGILIRSVEKREATF